MSTPLADIYFLRPAGLLLLLPFRAKVSTLRCAARAGDTAHRPPCVSPIVASAISRGATSAFGSPVMRSERERPSLPHRWRQAQARPWSAVLLVWLSVGSVAMAQDATPQVAAPQVATPQALPSGPAPPADAQDLPEYHARPLPKDTFKPSEKINQDYPVAFPVDI